jgi:protein-tyrosine phosphatase
MTSHSSIVLFICTGNFYRSRFCEHLFNAMAEQRQLPWRAVSRGLRTWLADGYGPISDFAVERLTELGIRLNGDARYPVQLTEADLQAAHLAVALKEIEHRRMMVEQFSDWSDRIEYWRVDDIDCATADEALPICETCVEALVERLMRDAT